MSCLCFLVRNRILPPFLMNRGGRYHMVYRACISHCSFPIEEHASLQASSESKLHTCWSGQLVNGGWPWSACGTARGGGAPPRLADTLGALREFGAELRDEQKKKEEPMTRLPQTDYEERTRRWHLRACSCMNSSSTTL